jgi:hypothetical protein
MNDAENSSLEAREAQALEKYGRLYRQAGQLTAKAQNTIAAIVSLAYPSQMTQAKGVCTNLMVRISNELRVVRLLCDSGYPLQAYSPAAALYEAAWTVACIGDDETEADKWWTHSDEKKSYDQVRDLTDRGLRKLGFAGEKHQARFERDYFGKYRDLCMGKHINPIFQRFQSVKISPESVNFVFGPDLSAQGERQGLWVMTTGVSLVYPALWTFLCFHVPKTLHQIGHELYQALEQEHLLIDSEFRNKYEP